MPEFSLSDFNLNRESILICREHVRDMLSGKIICTSEQCEFCPFGRRYRKNFSSCSQFRNSSAGLIRRDHSDSVIRGNLMKFMDMSSDISKLPAANPSDKSGHLYCHKCANWNRLENDPHKGYCAFVSYADTRDQAAEEYHYMTGLNPSQNTTMVCVDGEWRVIYDVRRVSDTCLKYRGL